MQFGEEIDLIKKLTPQEDKTIQLFFDSLPLTIRGITPNNCFGNLEKRVPLEIISLKRLEGPFVLQPTEGCKIKLYLERAR